MELTQFEIKTVHNQIVKGEYEGNTNSEKVIIFSHGFGVTRSSHGMFNEIGDALKNEYLIVRFDYAEVNQSENFTRVGSLTSQAEKLSSVIAYINQLIKVKQLNFIAHSMGCVILGMVNPPSINKCILLAGPSTSPYLRLKDYFSKRPETVIDESSESTIKRSDGSTTYVEKEFWHEVHNINPSRLYHQLADNSDVSFIQALNDQVLTNESYESIMKIPKIKFSTLNANHDFEFEARTALVNVIKNILW